jgi:competence protein ComEC
MFSDRIDNRTGRWAAALATQHRRQPLAAVAVLFLSGIACGFRWGDALAAGIGAAVCAVAWVLGSRLTRDGSRFTARLSLFLLPLLAGWTLAALDRDGRAGEARRFLGVSEARTFVCRVGPEVVVTPLKGHSAKVTFRAEAVTVEDGGFAIRRLPVEITWFGAVEGGPQPGERWRLRGKGRARKGRNGLLGLAVNTGEGRAERLAAADAAAWRVRAARMRREAARRVAIGIEGWGDIPALNQAMLLGSRYGMPPAMRRVFVDSGTIHVFAISGLHIVLVAAVFALAVSAFGVPRNCWVLLVGPPLVFYTVMTGARPSAVRACLMALLYLLAPLIGRRPDGGAALAGTALIVHALRPALLYDVGSVLSFAVMGGLVVFCRPFCDAARRACRLGRLEEQARLLRAAGAAVRAKRVDALAGATKWVADSFAVSLAAWLASVPLTAYYFGRFTPGGLLANLVVGPCAFFVVVGGCLGLAASGVSAWLASSFNHAAGFFTWVMVATAKWTAARPGANVRVENWPPWAVWAWFGALLVAAVWLRVRRPRDGLEWLENN